MFAWFKRRIFRPAAKALERAYLKLAGRLFYHLKYIRLTYSFVGILFALVTSSAIEKIEHGLPQVYGHAVRTLIVDLQYVTTIFAVLFILQFLFLAGAILFGKDEPPPPPPPDTEIKFTARSSTIYPELSKLTEVATEQFEGDTMRKEVVQSAFRNGSALGLRIKDDHARDVGFFDFYHLKADVLTQWIAGDKFEKDIVAEDFEPIAAAAARGDKHLQLFVGALLLKSRNRVYDYYMAPMVVMATHQHMRQALAAFDKVTIYASIFSEAGARYAQIEGMKPYMRGTDRGPAGDGHDVFVSSFSPQTPENRYVAVSRTNVYVLQIDNS